MKVLVLPRGVAGRRRVWWWHDVDTTTVDRAECDADPVTATVTEPEPRAHVDARAHSVAEPESAANVLGAYLAALGKPVE